MGNTKRHLMTATIAALFITMGIFSSVPVSQPSMLVYGQETYPRYETLIIPSWGEHPNYDFWNPYGVGFDATYTGSTLNLEPLFWGNWVNGTLVAILATGYEMDDDALIYTIHVRDDVYWNDGEKWGMDDIIYTLDLARDNPSLTIHGWYITYVESHEKVDETTFTLTLKEPNAHFINNIGFGGGPILIFPKHIVENYADPGEWANTEHVWTGPYNLVNVEVDSWIYEKNPDYWGLYRGMFANSPKYIIYTNFARNNEKMLMAIAADELDWIYHEGGWWSTWESANAINPDIEFWYQYAVCQDSLYLSHNKYPTNMPEFRKAISYAINRDKYIEIFGEGHTEMGRASVGMFGAPAAQELGWMPQDLAEKYDYGVYDPDKAEQILLSLNFTRDAEGYWHDANGTLAEYEIRYNWQPQEARLMQEIMEDFGIKLIPKELKWATYSADFDRGGIDTEWAYFWGTPACAAIDPYPNLNAYYGPNALPIGERGGTNDLRWQNATFDEYFVEWKNLPADNERAMEIYRKMYEILLAEIPIVPVYDKVYTMLLNNKYWTNWPTNTEARPAQHSYETAIAVMYLEPTGYGQPTNGNGDEPSPSFLEQYGTYVAIAVIVVVVGVGAIVLRRKPT